MSAMRSGELLELGQKMLLNWPLTDFESVLAIWSTQERDRLNDLSLC